MNIHEYQAKRLLGEYGIPVPPGLIFTAGDLSVDRLKTLTAGPFVIKAQVHAGGRGKAGGIKIVDKPEQAIDAAKNLLGKELVTYQTGGKGKPIDSVLIEHSNKLVKELYLGVTLDRASALPCVIASEAGGVDIEEVARTTPEKVLKRTFDPANMPKADYFESFLAPLAKVGVNVKEMAGIVEKLARFYVEKDATLVEINPLSLMVNGTLLTIDAKVNIDDNALFRHPEIVAMHDPRQEDAREVEAKKFDLSYVGLDGNIGCMVNGAGLAMATMDLIKLSGGEPANFLDVGGGASKEKVSAAFRIILQDPRVEAILVNIFGGIMRCDVIAEGILAALEASPLKVPLVVRLEGTNVKEGKEILAKSKLKVITADSFLDGAQKVVAASKGK